MYGKEETKSMIGKECVRKNDLNDHKNDSPNRQHARDEARKRQLQINFCKTELLLCD